MALAALLARAAEGDALIDDDALFHFRRLADDDAHAVVDEDAWGDLRGGVNLDARQKLCKLRRPAREKTQVHLIEAVCKAVPRERVHARIGEPDLKLVACGGVVALRRLDILPQSRKKHIPLLLFVFRCYKC